MPVMMVRIRKLHFILFAWALFVSIHSAALAANETSDIQKQLEELRLQNQKLQEQIQKQDQLIRSLGERLDKNSQADDQRDNALKTVQNNVETQSNEESGKILPPLAGGRINLSGEAGLALLHTSSRGAFPNAEFKIDEARLFLDAKVVDNIYFFTELNIATRETDDEFFQLGELYVDFENVSRFFNQERLLNIRFGRFDIPFGEEYLVRDAIDNPLITHSLSDIWGIDEGLEFYGSKGQFSYVLAVQNGGHPSLRDYDSDKAFIARLSYDPKKWLHLSVSGMRTGDLHVQKDILSEVWFGNGFIRNLTTNATRFDANIFQGDVQFRLRHGHFNFSGGILQSDDNSAVTDDFRRSYFYSAEAVHTLTGKLYGALRFSQIFIDSGGMPLVGNGNMGRYFFNNANLTENLWRLSAGLGYRLNRNVLFKGEYSFEQGQMIGNRTRSIDFLGAEMAVGF